MRGDDGRRLRPALRRCPGWPQLPASLPSSFRSSASSHRGHLSSPSCLRIYPFPAVRRHWIPSGEHPGRFGLASCLSPGPCRSGARCPGLLLRPPAGSRGAAREAGMPSSPSPSFAVQRREEPAVPQLPRTRQPASGPAALPRVRLSHLALLSLDGVWTRGSLPGGVECLSQLWFWICWEGAGVRPCFQRLYRRQSPSGFFFFQEFYPFGCLFMFPRVAASLSLSRSSLSELLSPLVVTVLATRRGFWSKAPRAVQEGGWSATSPRPSR